MNSIRGILTYISIFLVCWSGAYAADDHQDELQQALKLTPDVDHGKQVYQLCASCHYHNGWGKADGSFPVIAGQHRQVLIKQLADIRSRKRNNPTMYPFTDSTTLGDVQAVADVAAYVATLSPDPAPGKGSGEQLAKAKSLYAKHCAQCHGEQGAGVAESFYPRLKGQHYAYALRQLRWMKSGFRRNADKAMLAQLADLKDEDLMSLADYISRL